VTEEKHSLNIEIKTGGAETQKTQKTFGDLLRWPMMFARNVAMHLAVAAWAFNQVQRAGQTFYDWWAGHRRQLLDEIRQIRGDLIGLQGIQAPGAAFTRADADRLMTIAKQHAAPYKDVARVEKMMGQLIPGGRAPQWTGPVVGAARAAGHIVPGEQLGRLMAAMETYKLSPEQASWYATAMAIGIPKEQAEHARALEELLPMSRARVAKPGVEGMRDVMYPYMYGAAAGLPPLKLKTAIQSFLHTAVIKREHAVEGLAADFGYGPGARDIIKGGKFTDLQKFFKWTMGLTDEHAVMLEQSLGGKRPGAIIGLLRGISPDKQAIALEAVASIARDAVAKQQFEDRYRGVAEFPPEMERAAEVDRGLLRKETQLGRAPQRALYAKYLQFLEGFRQAHPMRYKGRFPFQDPLGEAGSLLERAAVEGLLDQAGGAARARDRGPKWATRLAYMAAYMRAWGVHGLIGQGEFRKAHLRGMMRQYEGDPDAFRGRYPELYEELQGIPESGVYRGWEKSGGFAAPSSGNTNIIYNNGGRASDQAALRSAAMVTLGFGGALGVAAQEAVTLQPH